jgi:hypothetical protein
VKISYIGILVFVILASGCVSNGTDTINGKSNQNSGMTVEEIRTNAEKIPYSNLANYPEKVNGDALFDRGKVVQSLNTESKNIGIINTIAREKIGIGGGRYTSYGSGPVYAKFNQNVPKNGTVINYLGVADGTKTYKNTRGEYVTVPKINIVEHNKELQINVTATREATTEDMSLVADKICVNDECVYNKSYHPFTISYGGRADIEIAKEGYETYKVEDENYMSTEYNSGRVIELQED